MRDFEIASAGVLTIDENGRIASADEEATRLFRGNPAGETLNEIIDRSGEGGQWIACDGARFEADVFGVRRADGSLELRLHLPPADDDTITRRRRDSLLRISTDVFRAGPADLDEVIVTALGRIGRLTRADRAYLIVMTDDHQAQNTHEWSRSGTDPQIDRLGNMSREEFGWFEERLIRDEALIIPRLEDLPPSAEPVRNELAKQGIKSLLALGIFEGDELVGVAGYDTCGREARWSVRSIERLRLIAELFIQSILRARASGELRQQQELFHYVQLATNDIIWDIDLESGKTWRSDSLESVLGVSPAPDQDGEWWMERIHPEDRTVCRSKVSELLSNPARSFLEHTYRIRHRDGSWVSILDRGYIIRDENSQAKRMIGTCTDVTEQQRFLRRLEDSEARFKTVVENVSDVISIVNRNGIIVYQSPSSSRTLGFPPKERVGQSMFQHTHPADRPRVEFLFRDALTNNTPEARGTFRYKHAAGHWLTLETVGVNFIDREQIGGIVLVSRDITQRRHMEQQLERSTRLASLGHLASSVAHEFNNVLMGAQPFAEVISRKADDEQIRSAALRISEALEKGKQTSRALLNFARPLSVSLETIDLRGWIRAIEDEIRRIVPETISIALDISDEPLRVTADPMGLHQSLLNLILNACDVLHNREGGMIVVGARPATAAEAGGEKAGRHSDEYIVLSVSDNGPLLSSESLEHMFDPMFTGRRTRNGGLDLAVVHQLITAQSGHVKVTSEPEGTTFSIYLRASESSGDRPEIEESVVAPSTTPDLILLVEDNAIVASGIAAVLELEGQKVEVVGTGAEAIAHVNSQRPAVLILDIGLPDMSGIEVYETIAETHPDLPVIFSSGHGDQQELKSYLARSNVEFLLKPYDAQTLMSIVERLRQQTN